MTRPFDDHRIKLRRILAVDLEVSRIEIRIDGFDRDLYLFQRWTRSVSEDSFEYRNRDLRLT